MLQVAWFITFVLVVLFGIYAGRNIKNIQEWSVGGRTFSWIDITALLAAFQMGGTTIVGIAQNGYLLGYGGVWYSITGTLGILVLALFARKIRENMDEDSVSAYIEKRFSSKVGDLYSYTYLLMGFFYIPIQLFALTTIIQVVIPGTSLYTAAIIGLLLSVSYTVVSGIQGAKAVGKITCLLTYGIIVVGVIVMVNKIGGYSTLTSNLPESYFSLMTLPMNTIIGWFVTTAFGYLTMQAALQPVLSAKDNKSAVMGVIGGALLSLPVGFFTATTGLVAKVKLPDIESSNAFVATVVEFLPAGFSGMIFGTVALIIATTLATQVLAVGTLLKNVYVTKINRNADEKKVLLVSRLSTSVFILLTLIPIFSISRAAISQIFVILIACATGPMIFTVLGGLYWKKATTKGAASSIIVGLIVGVAWVLLGLSGSLHPIFPIVIATFATGIIVSLATYRSSSDI